jgi:hypothetical protein
MNHVVVNKLNKNVAKHQKPFALGGKGLTVFFMGKEE